MVNGPARKRTTRRLTLDLPIPVWDRLADEAAEAGKPIGTYVKALLVTRDERRKETK